MPGLLALLGSSRADGGNSVCVFRSGCPPASVTLVIEFFGSDRTPSNRESDYDVSGLPFLSRVLILWT